MSRRNILLFSALCAAAALSIRMVQQEESVASYAYMNLIGQVFLTTILGGCLFMWGPDTSFVPAPWLLTLPLATRRYLVLFYAYVIVVVGTIACALTALHMHLFGNIIREDAPRVVLEFWQMPLLCVALACLVQSMFHLSGIKNEFRVIPMAIAAEVLAFVCVLSVLDPGNMNGHRIEQMAVAAVVFAWASSYSALSAHRNGKQRGGITALLEWFDLGQGRTSTFASPDRALFWLGWRRYGRMFPLWTLGLGLMCLALISGAALLWREPFINSPDFQGIMLVYAGTLPAVACATVLSHLFILIRTREDLFGAGRGYFLALPVRSAALARGRLLAITLSVSLVLAVELALFFSVIYFSHTPPLDPDVAVTILLATVAVWLVLWFGLILAGGYVISLLVLACIGLMLDPTGGQHMVDYFLSGLAFLSIATAALFLFRGIKRGLLNRLDWDLFAAACLPIAAVPVFLLWTIPVWPDPTIWYNLVRYLVISVLALGALLPVALPFVAVPVLTDWIRHR